MVLLSGAESVRAALLCFHRFLIHARLCAVERASWAGRIIVTALTASQSGGRVMLTSAGKLKGPENMSTFTRRETEKKEKDEIGLLQRGLIHKKEKKGAHAALSPGHVQIYNNLVEFSVLPLPEKGVQQCHSLPTAE